MDSPKIPDQNLAAIEGTLQDAKNFPFKYAIDATSKMGGVWKDPVSGKVYDFTGLGDADNAAIISDKMAQTLLDIQKDYGPEFIKQRLKDLEQADPKGYAARKQLFDKIIADSESNPNRPLAEDTQKQVLSLLEKGGQLSAGAGSQTEQVQQGVRGKQLRSGIYLGNAPASEEASAVEGASEAQRTARQQQAIQFQTSGVSPEDVEYRRIQQSLGNLGAFVNGQSPTAQFQSLSGAQGGAAPFTTTGGSNVGLNPNAAQQGINNANSIYGIQAGYNSRQVSPAVSAISGAANGFSTYLSLGGQNPFATQAGGAVLNKGFQNANPSGVAGDTYG